MILQTRDLSRGDVELPAVRHRVRCLHPRRDLIKKGRIHLALSRHLHDCPGLPLSKGNIVLVGLVIIGLVINLVLN